MAGAATGTVTAREIYFDFGESLDVFQILGQGGGVLVGETVNGLGYGTKMAQDNITANSGGGQANAVQITSPQARITVVAAAGDSVILPISKRGMQIAIVNDAAANACNVFPATGDTINGAAPNTAFSLAAVNGAGAGPTIFYCYSAGAWRTK